jgi:hypothetical protein
MSTSPNLQASSPSANPAPTITSQKGKNMTDEFKSLRNYYPVDHSD